MSTFAINKYIIFLPILSICIIFFLFNTEVGRDLFDQFPDNFYLAEFFKKTASMASKDNSVQEVTPIEVLRDITLTDLKDNSTFKASNIWQSGPALIFVVRRPGCQLCREDAVRISSQRDLIFGKMGLNMVAIVHEILDNEVEEFNEGFWKGTVYFDKEKAFYNSLGGGKLQYAGFVSFIKPSVWSNIRRNYKTGVTGNFKGDGSVLGGLYIIKSDTEGVVYQYREKVWGDQAPLKQVLKACEQASPRKGDTSIQSDIQAALEKAKSETLLLKNPEACTSEICG
ncbi:hypothetical protein C1645_769977 [Glomus cerebriforme]|uniref:Peroxiredoxin-like 2A n=1 Tax=Glomus cerebriforme TaxID=658196 RepID=A0A397T2E4_9GLOM|nr:hypothetical protein C1645_769977 [Glomus cerebriforme]